MNFSLIFKAIPWRTILEQLPLITETAQSTYQRFNRRRTDADLSIVLETKPGEDTAARVAHLEALVRDMQADEAAQVEVIRKLSEELASQASALEILGARQTLLFWVASGSFALSLILLLVMVFR